MDNNNGSSSNGNGKMAPETEQWINFMQTKSVYNMLMFEIKLIFNAKPFVCWSVLI